MRKTPLERIAASRAGVGRWKSLLQRAVSAARKQRISWAKIARALGITKQGAMKHYGKKKLVKATKVATLRRYIDYTSVGLVRLTNCGEDQWMHILSDYAWSTL